MTAFLYLVRQVRLIRTTARRATLASGRLAVQESG
jgi:hypothetical protein